MRHAAAVVVWGLLGVPSLLAQEPPALVVKEGAAGTREGHAIAELKYWIGWGDYDLAEAAYRIGWRDVRTPSVRFVRSWGLLNWAVARKSGFDRALAALDEIDATDPALRDHA